MLVTTFPGYGHFHPVAPLALAFQRAGHDVKVATDPGFGQWVERCGLAVLPAGLSEREAIEGASAFPQDARAAHQFTSVSVPPFATDVLAAARDWRPDFVVSEEGEHAGPLIASSLGVPSATHSWPAPARPAAERAAREAAMATATVWRELVAAARPRLYGDVYLDCCPPPLQTNDIEGVGGVRIVRPTLFDGPPAPPPPWLADAVAPVVFVTLGTVSIFADPAALQLLVDAVVRVAGTVIVATGPHRASVIAAHPNVRSARYFPLSSVLPSTDLVVSHGGASTTLACLLAGVPHVVVPRGAPSQHRAAARVAALGIGAAVEDADADADGVEAAARALLDDPQIHQRMSALRASLDGLPTPDEVAADLARL